MFNFKNKDSNEVKKYRGNKIYLARVRNIEIEKVWSIIFSMVEGYVKQEQRMPEKIIINKQCYEKIIDYNNKLIIEKDNKKYILCTELEVEERFRRRWES